MTGYDQTVPEQVTVAVVVPVRDEERLLRTSLAALRFARDHVQAAGVAVRVAVVLDRCRDRSREIACDFAASLRVPGAPESVHVLETDVGNVGMARAHGFRHLLGEVHRDQLARIWLATTDADTQVPPGWLAHQLARRAEGVDAWAGTVVVADWSIRTESLRHAYQAGYARDVHVHGANMGFRADAYLRAGGFPPYATAEDQALWHALSAAGARISYDQACPVITSARRRSRAPRGFAQFLNDLEGGRSSRR